MLKRRFADTLSTISQVKVPIAYPASTPPAPLQADYDMLGVLPTDDNRTIISKFRSETALCHPAVSNVPSHHTRYSQLEAAYNRIALFRMAEQGVPQPFTMVHNYAHAHTKLIKEFCNLHAVEENAFFTPHVPERYVTYLACFWAVFGLGYSVQQHWDPLGLSALLRQFED